MAALTAPDVKHVKTERFDINIMQQLLCHDGVDAETKRLLKAYKRKRENGNFVQVVYEYGKSMKALKRGRVYPQRGLGLQGFPSDVRCALAGKYYWDLDMVNSQPAILYQLCERNGWRCDRLKDYVLNRSAHLAMIMSELDCSRDDAKVLCLTIMFGGRPKECPPFLNDLMTELARIGSNIASTYPEIMKACAKEKNPTASCVAHVCQDIEFRILQHIDAVLAEHGRQMDTYIHDGGLVHRGADEVEFPQSLMQTLEQRIRDDLGYTITLAIKPMTHSFAFRMDVYRIGNHSNNGVLEREYLERKMDFEEQHFYCKETDTVVDCSHNEVSHISRSAAPIALAHYNFTRIHDNLVATHDFVAEWLKDPTKRTVRKFVFQPDSEVEVPDDCYNLFNGIGNADEPMPANKDAIIERFKLLVDQNAGKIPEMYDYMIKWYALAVQRPHVAPGVAIILATENQGVGKDTVASFFGTRVIGKEYYFHTRNVETDLFDTHSTAFDRKLFHHLEEVSGSVNRKHADMLKSFITASIATINPKGMKKYSIEAYPHIIMTTNNTVPVKVESTDRRFCISYPSSDYMGNMPFWRETYGLLFDTPGAGKAVAEYLKGVDLTSFVSQDFPKGEYHQMLAESEEPSERIFVKVCDAFEPKTGSDLHTDYVAWCRENKFEPKSCVHFCRSLTPMVVSGLLKRGRDRLRRSLYSKEA